MTRHVLTLSALLVATLSTACGGGAGGPPVFPPTPVAVVAPLAKELPLERPCTGRIAAVDHVELKPEVSGKVLRILVGDGAVVAAGQPLVEIESLTFAADLARTEAQFAEASARQQLAKLQLERFTSLVEQKLAMVEERDSAVATSKAADAVVAAIEASRTRARIDLARCQVLAPMAGRLGEWRISAGDLVQGGGPVPATVMNSINSEDPIEVQFDLDDAGWTVGGDRLRAAAAGGAAVTVKVGLPGETGHPHIGMLTSVDNRIDERSGTIRLRARLANPTRALTPGLFARVLVELTAPKPELLIPEEAVMAQAGGRLVWLIMPAPPEAVAPLKAAMPDLFKPGAPPVEIAMPRPVQVGRSVGGMRIVEGGLAPTDRVVVSNQMKMFFPGIAVVATLKDAAPEKPATAAPVH